MVIQAVAVVVIQAVIQAVVSYYNRFQGKDAYSHRTSSSPNYFPRPDHICHCHCHPHNDQYAHVHPYIQRHCTNRPNTDLASCKVENVLQDYHAPTHQHTTNQHGKQNRYQN